MPSPHALRIGALLALLASTAAMTACTATAADVPRTVNASGRVRDDVVVVRAPMLARPVFDPRVGLPGTPTPAAAPRAAASSGAALSGSLVSVEVVAPARVATGAPLARIDERELALGVRVARTAATRTRANVAVIDDKLGTLRATAATLRRNRATAVSALAQGRAGRATLAANIAALDAVVAKLPPLPAPIPIPGPDPRVLLPELKAKLAAIDAKLARGTAGLAKLDAGTVKLADARSTLSGVRDVVRLSATAADAGVAVAEARLAQARVTAPVSGTVLWVAEPGTVLTVDAPMARIRPAGPLVVETYLAQSEASRVRPGARARVRVDSLPGSTFPGRVTAVRELFEYPPTSLPTAEIHMIRAFRVSVTLDDPDAWLPPGTPADLTIDATP